MPLINTEAYVTDQSAGSSTAVAMLVSEGQEEAPCGTTMQYEVATLNGSSHQEFQRPQEVHVSQQCNLFMLNVLSLKCALLFRRCSFSWITPPLVNFSR